MKWGQIGKTKCMAVEVAITSRVGALGQTDCRPIVERLCRRMAGRVSQKYVEAIVIAAAAGFRDARIELFVPVLVERRALAALRQCHRRPLGVHY